MINIFISFEKRYVSWLMNKKHFYLVSQTYHLGKGKLSIAGKTNLLLTDYDNLFFAQQHYNILVGKKDKYAAILNLQKETHRAKIGELLQDSSDYCLFWAVIRNISDVETALNRKYKDNLRRYIENRTNLRFHRDITLQPALIVEYGELYVALKHGGQTVKIKFEDIETA